MKIILSMCISSFIIIIHLTQIVVFVEVSINSFVCFLDITTEATDVLFSPFLEIRNEDVMFLKIILDAPLGRAPPSQHLVQLDIVQQLK